MTGLCPHCNKDIDTEIYNTWAGDYWTDVDDFPCPQCGEIMEIRVEMEPVFHTKKKGVTL